MFYLAICSPSCLPFFNLSIDNDLHNSDHFPLVVTNNRCNHHNSYQPSRYVSTAAYWDKFASLSNITIDMVDNNSVHEALDIITQTIINAANSSIPRTKVFALSFLPSRVGEGALHEKLLPLCLLPASLGQQNTPRVGRAWRPIRRVVHFGPRCINRPVSQPHGWSAQGDQTKVVNFWGLALRVVNVPGSDPERIGPG
ncbi:hypothetical protein AVEN_194441-1 [Araneus ventricosus]|uniref:Endonuclease/exonuclease/phosphatase domain-containing protein n=1 Tax=Araneus ventricosus TaxID=182803 RepID=A0A4Y2A5X9_ARAVE|nr:hypothetical protein AVEN_194441-1 [Araneus ventricosus]